MQLSLRVGSRTGVNADMLRGWVQPPDVDAGRSAGITTEDARKIQDLEAESRSSSGPTRSCRAASVLRARCAAPLPGLATTREGDAAPSPVTRVAATRPAPESGACGGRQRSRQPMLDPGLDDRTASTRANSEGASTDKVSARPPATVLVRVATTGAVSDGAVVVRDHPFASR